MYTMPIAGQRHYPLVTHAQARRLSRRDAHERAPRRSSSTRNPA
jgi:hypothetical protein